MEIVEFAMESVDLSCPCGDQHKGDMAPLPAHSCSFFPYKSRNRKLQL